MWTRVFIILIINIIIIINIIDDFIFDDLQNFSKSAKCFFLHAKFFLRCLKMFCKEGDDQEDFTIN